MVANGISLMEGFMYPEANSTGEKDRFMIYSSGGPLLAFLTLLLFAAYHKADEEVEICVETYNNKRNGSRINIDTALTNDDLEIKTAEYYERLWNRSMYSPVYYIPRFFDHLKDMLVPFSATIRHG